MKTIRKHIASHAPSDTERIGEAIGARLRGCEVLELTSDLGGGKTTFTRGVVAALSPDTVVSSPTFTVGKVYETPRLTVYHYDFYRLGEAGLIADELAESLEDPRAIVIVEWADVVRGVLPESRVKVRFETTDEQARILTIECPEDKQYLLEEV
jgi:tRNA threonylcarbamoyladenosine biosynthesis protein TsaE